MSQEEEILGIFPIWMQRSSWTRKDFRKLVFTTNRLIAAKQKLRLGQLYNPDYVASYANAGEKLKMKEISAESILKADAENLSIPYSSIPVVEVKTRGENLPMEFDIYLGNIDVPKYKTEIPIRYKHHEAFKGLLKEVLPSKAKWNREIL